MPQAHGTNPAAIRGDQCSEFSGQTRSRACTSGCRWRKLAVSAATAGFSVSCSGRQTLGGRQGERKQILKRKTRRQARNEVFVFDLVPMGRSWITSLDGLELPYRLQDVTAIRTFRAHYAEHLEAGRRLSGLASTALPSTNIIVRPMADELAKLIAAAAIQRTSAEDSYIYGNNYCRCTNLCDSRKSWPCWTALSEGRIISGFARGIPRE